jgi:hypothetical protein
MSTKKKVVKQSAYDFIRRPAGEVSIEVAANSKQNEEDQGRMLKLRPWKALDDLRRYVGDDGGWYQLQMRLYVAQEFIGVVNHLYNAVDEETGVVSPIDPALLEEMRGNADDAILALNAAAKRVNNKETTKRYLTPMEALMVEIALRQGDELEPHLTKVMVYKVYRHVQEFLAQGRPK